ncbi:GTPase/DUF3482 domain-containing protein [Ideonella sp.]|uniref:GTPase/DUF3482 domain-containing protein n=1 Tax=Ideonella sp. TaxID=1929293 RepID=UPI0035B49E7A
MAEAPLTVAVVGHTNAGKTSLLRTLTRRRDVGEVSDRPGTTRHAEAVVLALPGAPPVRLVDTPGLEDPVGLLALVRAQPGRTPAERLRAALSRPEAQAEFEQEAKVLRALLAADAAFYVVDTREPVLPKHHAEVALLHDSGRPVMPVLNQLRDPSSRWSAWRTTLAEHGLHVQAQFDAVAPFMGAEARLYRDLATLLSDRREPLEALADALAEAAVQRQAAGWRLIAHHLLGLAALRETLSREELADAARRADRLAAFRDRVATGAREAAWQLLQLHGFEPGDAELAGLPALQGDWEADLFNPDLLQQVVRHLGAGALVGAALGLGLDIALHGLTLGVGTSIGAALGGAAAQGLGPLGRLVALRATGRQDVQAEDAVLVLLAARLAALQEALAERGHGAVQPLRPDTGQDAGPGDAAVAGSTRWRALARALSGADGLAPARARPAWAEPGPADARRQRADEALAGRLRAAWQAPPDSAG